MVRASAYSTISSSLLAQGKTPMEAAHATCRMPEDEQVMSPRQCALVDVEGGTTFICNTDVTEARYQWVSVRESAP